MRGYEWFKENIEHKIRELIAEIEIARCRKWYERLEKDIEVLKGVREALDKQIPAEAIKLKRDVDTNYKCPCCYTFVTLSRKYCDQCGQALKFTK